MTKQPNMKMIGLFICLSALMVVLGFGYFLKSEFSNRDAVVVMYFDESVKGLDTGAPVLFKGVKIGEVTQVKLEANLETMNFLIPVYAKIYNGRSLITGKNNNKEVLETLIRHGLRAQLAISSVITGQLLIELDMYPDTPIILTKDDSDENEIPTISSHFAEISRTLKIMPVAKIAQDVQHITQTLNKGLPPLIEKMTNTLDTVDDILIQNKNNTTLMVKEIGAAAQSFDALIDNNANNIAQMIDSFNAAAASMKNLTDYLQMYPNSIITGKEY